MPNSDGPELRPLLGSFDDVFPPTPLPGSDVFPDTETRESDITSALGELRTTATGLKSGVGWTFMKRFARLWRMGFDGWFSRMAIRFYLVALAGIASGVLGSFLQITVVPKLLMAVLMAEKTKIATTFVWGCAAFGSVTIMSCAALYHGELLALDWRKAMTRKAHNAYFSGKSLYWLNQVDKRIDNADQRIADDFREFTHMAAKILFGTYDQPLAVPHLLAAIAMSIYFVVHTLSSSSVGIGFAYFVGSFIVMNFLMIPVARSTFIVNQGEGFFRFRHARLKEFAECVAFYNGQEQEHKAADEAFESLYWRMRGLFKRAFYLVFWVYFQGSATTAMSTLVVTLFIVSSGSLDGQPVTAGTSQTAINGISQLISSLSGLPAMFAFCAQLAGITHRCAQLLEALDELKDASIRLASRCKIEDSTSVGVTGVHCRTPDGRVLFDNLTFHVSPGKSLLIMGPSGSGKSSLLRVVAGLWPVDRGSVFRPMSIGEGGLFFVPQRPYITQGSLRTQILYPDTENMQQCPDSTLMELLEVVGLEYLLLRSGGLDAAEEWADALSLGEQQRLAFARLFYHGPRFAIMDESTSALNVELEARCLSACKSRGITLISVGHRPSLMEYHETLLNLTGNGGYKLSEIGDHPSSSLPPAPADPLAFEPLEVSRTGSVNEVVVSVDHSTASTSSVRRRNKTGSKSGERRSGALAVSTEDRTYREEADNPWNADMFKKMDVDATIKLDVQFLRRFWRLFRAAFKGPFTKPTFVLVSGVVAICVAAGANILGTYVKTRAMTYLISEQFLVEKETGLAWTYIIIFFVSFVLQAFGLSFAMWVGYVVALYWQKQLIGDLQDDYFSSKVIYAANKMVPTLDNVDQRITDDTRLMTQGLFNLLLGNGASQGVFMGILVGVLNTAFAAQYGWFPLVGAYVVAFLSFYITIVLMKPIVPVAFTANKLEGHLRFAHARVREFAESIVFYGGQDQEHANTDQKFSELYTVLRHKLWVSFPTYFFSAMYQQLVGVVLFALITIYYLSLGGYKSNSAQSTFGLVITASGYLNFITSSYSSLTSSMSQFSDVAGLLQRIAHVSETLKSILSTYKYFEDRNLIADRDEVGTEKLVCRTPGGEVLFRNMSFTVRRGDHTIIMGPSGSGKSSLLRVLAGLWPFEEGRVFRPSAIGSGVLFLSQRPYIIDGSLRDQILYPGKASECKMSDDALKGLLRDVRLGHLVDEREDILDVERNWAEILSGGEQQRLGFARLLYHNPVFALMDESTSAMDVDLEAHCMLLTMRRGVTCVSVGHRPTLLGFHKFVLRLDGFGGYSFGPVGGEAGGGPSNHSA